MKTAFTVRNAKANGSFFEAALNICREGMIEIVAQVDCLISLAMSARNLNFTRFDLHTVHRILNTTQYD